MMTSAGLTDDVAALKDRAQSTIWHRRLASLAVPAVISAYLIYVGIAFDVAGLFERARLDNARTLVSDTYSYKTHVERDERSGKLKVAIEGEKHGTYASGAWPDWVREDGQSTVVRLADGSEVRMDPAAVTFTREGYGEVIITRQASGIAVDAPSPDLPEWINASASRVTATLPGARITVTRNRSEVFRYFAGWELFFFTLDSPFHSRGWSELAALALSGDAVREGQSNLEAMADDFWNNPMWRHKDVAWAIFETLLMAFLGTFGAAIAAFPLAFLAARNFNPSHMARFGVRRIFDFCRGVDGLIWTIVLSRAFGPGPLTGSLAMLLTDTGTFGKLYSEALENIDVKQTEGLRSTGANAFQRTRFGVLPQVAPVILSQILYYLESNTRSATIIGAIVGGGMGLLLTQAIQTQKDWEEVTYYIILTLLMVMAMDILSGWLRSRLIGSSASGRDPH